MVKERLSNLFFSDAGMLKSQIASQRFSRHQRLTRLKDIFIYEFYI